MRHDTQPPPSNLHCVRFPLFMALLLIFAITVMWLCTTGCFELMIPRLTTLTAMVVASLVTSTNTVLSQAMSHFRPIRIGAVSYVELARHLFPRIETVDTREQQDLLKAMGLVVYFPVRFKIVMHGLSIPSLELICRWKGVEPIVEMELEMQRRSVSEA